MTLPEPGRFAELPSLLHARDSLVLVAQAVDVLKSLPPDRLALPTEEATRIACYRNADDKRARYAAHGLVRHCLGLLLTRAPEDLSFLRDDKGRPALPDAKGIDFNISHSGSWIAVGLSKTGRIGVDIQESSIIFDWEAVSRAYLHSEEIGAIQRLPLPGQAAAALELWCLKEAFLKASGEGLATPPRQLYPRPAQVGWSLSHKTYELKGATAFLPDASCAAWACEQGATPHVIVL